MVARGSIGLYVCDTARALGASDVLYVDPEPGHRALASPAPSVPPPPRPWTRFGRATTSPWRRGGRVDQLALAVKCPTPQGMCESAGNHFRPGELPLLGMYLNGVTLRVARDDVRAGRTCRPHCRRGT